jgi:predicted nuclease with TOPRIM domain
MELDPFTERMCDLQDKLFKTYLEQKEKIQKLEEENAYLRAQLEEKEARLMEAKCLHK